MGERDLEERLRDLGRAVEVQLKKRGGFSSLLRAGTLARAQGSGRRRRCPLCWPPAVALAGVAALLFLSLRPAPGSGPAVTVAEERVDLDGRLPAEVVRVLRLTAPGSDSAGYLTTIWAADAGLAGRWNLVYSEGWAAGSEPLPVEAISLPDVPAHLLLAAAQEVKTKLLHYRVLGYDGTRVVTYLARSGVPAGEVTAGLGYIREASGRGEQRLYWWDGAAFTGGEVPAVPGPVVVSYSLDAAGRPAFTTPGPVRLRPGQYLLAMGPRRQEVRQAALPATVLRQEMTGFRALTPGSARLYLVPVQGGWPAAASLAVEVKDDAD